MCQDNGEILGKFEQIRITLFQNRFYLKDKNQIKTENSNSKNGAFTFDISEFDDPLVCFFKLLEFF